MPELPEVEVVRRGLDRWVVGRTITGVEVLDARSIRRYAPGTADFTARLAGATVHSAVRRGKFLWFPLSFGADDASPELALMAHLGMSGQLALHEPKAEDHKHLRVRISLSERLQEPAELRFIDQRIFGGLTVEPLVPTVDDGPGGLGSPASVIAQSARHIARDPLDPYFSTSAFRALLSKRKSGIKRSLLDQGVISGVGNIYADEALWRSKMHYEQPSDSLSMRAVSTLVKHLQDVMREAIDAGGTSFDSLYVNVNGSSGHLIIALKRVEGSRALQCRNWQCRTVARRQRVISHFDLARKARTEHLDSSTRSAAQRRSSGSRTLRGVACA